MEKREQDPQILLSGEKTIFVLTKQDFQEHCHWLYTRLEALGKFLLEKKYRSFLTPADLDDAIHQTFSSLLSCKTTEIDTQGRDYKTALRLYVDAAFRNKIINILRKQKSEREKEERLKQSHSKGHYYRNSEGSRSDMIFADTGSQEDVLNKIFIDELLQPESNLLSHSQKEFLRFLIKNIELPRDHLFSVWKKETGLSRDAFDKVMQRTRERVLSLAKGGYSARINRP